MADMAVESKKLLVSLNDIRYCRSEEILSLCKKRPSLYSELFSEPKVNLKICQIQGRKKDQIKAKEATEEDEEDLPSLSDIIESSSHRRKKDQINAKEPREDDEEDLPSLSDIIESSSHQRKKDQINAKEPREDDEEILPAPRKKFSSLSAPSDSEDSSFHEGSVTQNGNAEDSSSDEGSVTENEKTDDSSSDEGNDPTREFVKRIMSHAKYDDSDTTTSAYSTSDAEFSVEEESDFTLSDEDYSPCSESSEESDEDDKVLREEIFEKKIQHKRMEQTTAIKLLESGQAEVDFHEVVDVLKRSIKPPKREYTSESFPQTKSKRLAKSSHVVNFYEKSLYLRSLIESQEAKDQERKRKQQLKEAENERKERIKKSRREAKKKQYKSKC